MVPSSATAIDRMLPKRYSSGPSSRPIAISGTSVASVPHALPERVRTTVVSPMVSVTVSGVEPGGSVSVPQATRRAAAVADSRARACGRMGVPSRWVPVALGDNARMCPTCRMDSEGWGRVALSPRGWSSRG